MKKLFKTIVFLLAAASYSNAATYYIDYYNGSDSNKGTSTAAPWKRAPGMKGFAGAYSHKAGDRFLFKGGVTWPVGCFQMKITAGGSSDTNRDYYGADPAWYAGTSFTRPLFDFQHTLVGSGWTAAAGVLIEGCNYITFENIELARHRTPPASSTVNTWGTATICLSSCNGFTLSKCIIRDWDMPTPIPLGSSGGGGIIRVNSGGNNVVTHCEFHQKNVPVKTGTCIWNIGTVAYTEFHDTPTAIMSASLAHNNYIHHLTDPTDTAAHSNVMLCNGGLRAFNNLIHDISGVAQVIFLAPGYYGTAGQDWIYNNVIYNVAQPCIAIDTDGVNSQNAGSHIFNNTLVGAGGTGHCIRIGHRNNGPLALLETRNNHYITRNIPVLMNNPSYGGGYVTTFQNGPNLTQTPEQATSAGYIVSNAYQPVDASRPTVNKGVTLADAFGADIRGTARGQLGAWDCGAYEYVGSSSQPPGTPGTLVQEAATKSVSETAGSITLTVCRTGGSYGTISCAYNTVNGTAIVGVNYTAATGVLTWDDGDTANKTIEIPVQNTVMVGDRDFAVNLSAATGGAAVGNPASTVVTITGCGTVQPPPPPETTSLLTNPSFEQGLTGWTISGSGGVGQLPYQPTDGSRLAVFNWGQATPSGVLSQSFNTVAGQGYSLKFDVGAFAYNFDEQRIQVVVRGTSLLLSEAVSVFGAGAGSSKWSPQSFTFVADSPITTLTFRDISRTTMNLDLMLDNVRVSTSGPPPAQPPTITTHPASVTVQEGSDVTLTVEANGTGTLGYQWQFNGNSIPGATEASLTISSAQTADAGCYSVVVSNSGGSVTSSGADLTVEPAPNPQDPGTDPEDPDTDPQDPGTDPEDPGTDPEDPGTDPQDPGTDPEDPDTDPQDPGTDPEDPGTDPKDPGTDPEDPEEPSTPGELIANGSFELGDAGWTVSGNQGVTDVSPYQPSDGVKVAAFNWGQSVPNGSFSQSFNTVAGQTYGLAFDAGVLAFNYNEQRLQVTVRGGDLVLLSQVISLTGKGGGSTTWTPQSFTFVANGPAAALTFQDVSPTTLNLDLLLDNVRVTAIATPETPRTPLAITSQPASVTVTAGKAASFTIEATGTGTLSYQWRLNGSAIPGATSSSYTISSAQSSHAGSYDVVVADEFETVTSQAAVLTVNVPVIVNGFKNGSFESGYQFWTHSGQQDVTSATAFPGADGSRVVRFNAGNKPANGILKQAFATTPGQKYALTCSVGAMAYNWNEQRMLITVQGSTTLLSKTVSVSGAGGGSTRWAPQSFTFIADSETTTLTFFDVSPSTSAIDMVLDNVSVTIGN